jgi:hypothetical protein
MIQVRLVFQAKFGKAANLVALMKEYDPAQLPPGVPRPRSVRLLTDLSGRFDTVVQELEFDSYEAWQKNMAAMSADPRAGEMMAPSLELIEGGYKEFFTIEA